MKETVAGEPVSRILNYLAKRIGNAVFPHCLGLRGPHNQMRLRGLNIHSGKGTRGGAFAVTTLTISAFSGE